MLDDAASGNTNAWWTTYRGASPVVATAIHDGHAVRENLLLKMALDEDERLREEDPFTAQTIRDLQNRIVFHRSRFEVDRSLAAVGLFALAFRQGL